MIIILHKKCPDILSGFSFVPALIRNRNNNKYYNESDQI